MIKVTNHPVKIHRTRKLKIEGFVRYTHYGFKADDVDMRAEVGLLTRNVKIQGEMMGQNDTFGGHTKAIEGFKSYNVEYAELVNMGQDILGKYPIHYHMCK